jgi:AcrR family transcriptional regulator
MPPRAQSTRAKQFEGPARHELPREFVAFHKRRRIMDAIAELTAEQGYEATKIGDIVRRAGVARKTLYDNFEGKEQVFLAAFDASFEEVMARVGEVCAEFDGPWEERVEAGLGALLAYVAEEPARARMCMIEAMSATPAATQRYEDAVQSFVQLTGRNVPRSDQLPETIEETLVGGVAWIVHQKIRRHEAEKAMELLVELTEFLLAPYRGVAEVGQGRVHA